MNKLDELKKKISPTPWRLEEQMSRSGINFTIWSEADDLIVELNSAFCEVPENFRDNLNFILEAANASSSSHT